ncbi:MAG TPA: protein-disulfide reductase DsbD domain-containing protein [Steroidobacteraceae bacterium]|nr:protein-disulfide reductase DsbD domain-containing protein [Steroidobacteraceae bacterium]
MHAVRPKHALIPLAALILLAPFGLLAKPWWLRGSDANESDFLPPDVAFRVGSSIEGNTVKVRWVIAPGYYLYRHKIAVAPESADLLVAGIILPRGVMKSDRFLGNQEILTQQVEGTVPFRRFDFGAHPLQIKITYQGCAEAGLCYPPITKVLSPAGATADSTGAIDRPYPWESVAILSGLCAFLLAGLLLRKGRRLDPPPP